MRKTPQGAMRSLRDSKTRITLASSVFGSSAGCQLAGGGAIAASATRFMWRHGHVRHMQVARASVIPRRPDRAIDGSASGSPKTIAWRMSPILQMGKQPQNNKAWNSEHLVIFDLWRVIFQSFLAFYSNFSSRDDKDLLICLYDF